MSLWSGCRIRIVSDQHGLVCEDDDADLRIDEAGLELTYWDERGAVVFSGPPPEDEGYELVCRSRPRRATLRCPGQAKRLEGRWSEGDECGSWSVELPAHPSD